MARGDSSVEVLVSPDVGVHLAAYARGLVGGATAAERQFVVVYLGLYAVVAAILLVGWYVDRRAVGRPPVDLPPPVLPVSGRQPVAARGPLRDLAPDELAALLLGRMARLAALAAPHPPDTPSPRQRLVLAALASTYQDCERLGLAAQATAVLDATRAARPPPAERTP
jgi:hypothetical protein